MISEAAESLSEVNGDLDGQVLPGAAAAGASASIPQEVVDFAAHSSLHEALLKRAILREVAKSAEPMKQLEQWTHECLRSINATCDRYDRELGARLHARCREMAEKFWNEVRAQAAQLQEHRVPNC